MLRSDIYQSNSNFLKPHIRGVFVYSLPHIVGWFNYTEMLLLMAHQKL